MNYLNSIAITISIGCLIGWAITVQRVKELESHPYISKVVRHGDTFDYSINYPESINTSRFASTNK